MNSNTVDRQCSKKKASRKAVRKKVSLSPLRGEVGKVLQGETRDGIGREGYAIMDPVMVREIMGVREEYWENKLKKFQEPVPKDVLGALSSHRCR